MRDGSPRTGAGGRGREKPRNTRSTRKEFHFAFVYLVYFVVQKSDKWQHLHIAFVAVCRLKEQGVYFGRRRAAGVAREDGADRRPPLWSRLLRRITQRGRARHALLTYARRTLRLREEIGRAHV